jgi:hypothetical protein
MNQSFTCYSKVKKLLLPLNHWFYALSSLLFVFSCSHSRLSQPSSPPLLQKNIHLKACGPCSLAHAFTYASPIWRSNDFSSLPPEALARKIIEERGSLPSANSRNKKRWDQNHGMLASDLAKSAKEVAQRELVFIPVDTDLDISQALQSSLQQGFPPILGLHQQVHQKYKSRDGYYWIATKGHFITLIDFNVNDSLIYFTYIDSDSGKIHRGSISRKNSPILSTSPLSKIQRLQVSSYPQLDLPELSLGIARSDQVSGNELTSLILAP